MAVAHSAKLRPPLCSSITSSTEDITYLVNDEGQIVVNTLYLSKLSTDAIEPTSWTRSIFALLLPKYKISNVQNIESFIMLERCYMLWFCKLFLSLNVFLPA